MIEEQNVDLHEDCKTRINNLKRIRANLHEALRAHLPDYELRHVERQLESDRAQNLAAQDEIRDLKLQLQRPLSGNSKTKCETDPSDKMTKLIDERDSLAAEKEEMTKQYDHLKKECETANQGLIVAKDALIAAEQSAKDEKGEMTNQFDQLKKECETAKQDLIVARDALIAAEQSAKDKINEFDTKVAELADVKEKFATVEREKENILIELQSKEAALSLAMIAEQESEDTVKQLQQELTSTTEDLNSAQRALLAATGAKNNAEKSAKQMCTDLKAEKELCINTIRDEMAKEKEETIKQFDTVAAKLVDKNIKISKDLENATNAKQKLQRELSAIKEKMRLADAKRDAAKKELLESTNAKTEAEEKVVELKEELENLKDEFAANATISARIREPSEAEPSGLLQPILRDNERRSLFLGSQDNNDSGFFSSTESSTKSEDNLDD
ncbi:hypothetical protein SARC_08014 [Sphaeroforma arctica JP610]|uniref:Uncharacterized protein n=1 Tax=Sphaeroforma arctica JP610 TaxID=667725 RepID=A0A0L0FS79_9EUKA|nr:hypothetical protein SARC_08014 [Sphaeroforma arctica JP610]KNC79595.1 hypothetical protein SARC_08014 [Sphaeroforma arctica JP610]|eukprot:XP_014153497.1 hypothetical protein SARC_08014 [Sphaeroforma arctica JP610]